DVYQEYQIAGRPSGYVDIFAFDSDSNQLVLRLPWRRGGFGISGNRMLSGRRWVVVIEVIDHLFNSDGVLRWQLVHREEPANVRVRRRIDVDGKRRQGILSDPDERVIGDEIVGFRVGLWTVFTIRQSPSHRG